MGKLRSLIKSHTPDRIWQLMRIIGNPKKPKKTLKVEIHIADHCNLNCKGCDNFSCIAEQKFLDISIFERDLKRLKEIFGDKVEWISMMGGEPLLNENSYKYCHIARKLFPNALVRIITNGTMLLKQSEEFWRSISEDQVLLYVTKYPIKFDYDKAKAFAEEQGVKFQYAFESGDVLKAMYKTPLDLNGKQNPKLSYQLCGKGNKCITLKDGKLYTCETIANISTFNNFFSKNLEVTEDDYIDIFQENNPDVIMKKMASPVLACRYCDNIHYCSGIPWGTTKKEISEWV